MHTHRLAEPSPNYRGELTQVLAEMAGLKYVRAEDVVSIPVVRKEVSHVVYAPLADSPLDPDVVILFAHLRQSLVITEAVTQVDGSIPPAMGRPACAGIPQAMNTNRAALSLGCCGARAYLNELKDDIALWALPGAKIQDYVAAVETFGNANQALTQFHSLRKEGVAQGLRSTTEESLARMQQS